MKKLFALLLALTMVLALGVTAFADGEELYIPVIAKGYQHQFWATVGQGAQDAADKYGAEIYYNGPSSESEIAAQVEMVKTELTKNPKVLALAPLSLDAFNEVLEECATKEIPVIAFDCHGIEDPTGAIKATVGTYNEEAAAIAAEKFGEVDSIVEAMKNATPEDPVVIGCLSQDAYSGAITGRTTGFTDKMAEIAEEYQPGKVSIEGHSVWEKKVDDPAIIIQVSVAASTVATDVQTAANTLLNMKNLVAVFCSNEGAVAGFLPAVADGEDLAEGGKFENLVVAGFDAGSAQKSVVREGLFLGSVTQDPYSIGYQCVEMSVKIANGEEVENTDVEAKWYDSTNIDDEDISPLLYD